MKKSKIGMIGAGLIAGAMALGCSTNGDDENTTNGGNSGNGYSGRGREPKMDCEFVKDYMSKTKLENVTEMCTDFIKTFELTNTPLCTDVGCWTQDACVDTYMSPIYDELGAEKFGNKYLVWCALGEQGYGRGGQEAIEVCREKFNQAGYGGDPETPGVIGDGRRFENLMETCQ